MTRQTLSPANQSYPRFFQVRQKIVSHALANIDQAVQRAIGDVPLSKTIHPGQQVAIAVGSRGIANLKSIVAAVVHEVRQLGANPIIVPAMGSHGGATSEGQTAMLASLGVDEASTGAPVTSSMDTVIVGKCHGIDVHFDRIASQSHHVIIINRVKPHTRLTGRYESGLVKMLMIGLGKHRGAALYHQVFADFEYRLDRIASDVTQMINGAMPVTLGLAIIEDAHDHTSIIESVLPENFLSREPELLAIARSRMPRLPFDQAELLIVDQIGKEISGTGMDTNVIGRKWNDKVAAADEFPKIKQIYVRSLSAKSSGNAAGIGIAEYCHRRVVQAMDETTTRINCVTSEHVSAGAIPLTFDSDREVFDAVISQNGLAPIERMKWMRIDDTLRLETVDCSEGFWNESQGRDDLEILSEPTSISFDALNQWAQTQQSPGN